MIQKCEYDQSRHGNATRTKIVEIELRPDMLEMHFYMPIGR